MISWLATGPPVMVWVPPARVCTSCAWKFWIMPALMNTIAPITAIGSRIRNVIRTRSTQKLPSAGVGLTGEPAHHRDRDRDADRGGDEVLHRQAGHLGEVRQRVLTRVRLPVRVGHETDRGVPRRSTGSCR